MIKRPTYVASGTFAGGAFQHTATFNVDAGTDDNRCVVVWATYDCNLETVTSATCGGVAMLAGPEVTSVSSNVHGRAFVLAGDKVPKGAVSVTVTYGGENAGYASGIWATYSNVDANTSMANAVVVTNNSFTMTTATVPDTANDSLTIGIGYTDNTAGTLTVNGGVTPRINSVSGWRRMLWEVPSGAYSQAITATMSGGTTPIWWVAALTLRGVNMATSSPYLIAGYRKRARQPLANPVRLNRGHPLASVCVFAMPSPSLGDIVNGKQLTMVGGSKVVSHMGEVLQGQSAGACATIPLSVPSYRMTAAFWMYWDNYANDDHFAFELTNDVNNTANVGGFNMCPNSSFLAGNGIVYSRRATGSTRGFYYPRPSAGWHHYVWTLNNDFASDPIGEMYIDGVQQTCGAVLAGANSFNNFANSTLYFFSRNSATLFHAGRIANLRFFVGRVTDTGLVKSLYTDEWSLYEGDLPRILPDLSRPYGTMRPTVRI